MTFRAYEKQFLKVKRELEKGNTYLLNLTCETPVESNYTLQQLYDCGKAKYKLRYKNSFVHFSPEPFAKISDGVISSFPMKGTIKAGADNPQDQILKNKKELAEQFIIVDLIRNDLSIIATDVAVDDFRYIEKIATNDGDLFAVSSKISGRVKQNFRDKIGDIFAAMLPAGSVSGAPKQKTLAIISETESHQRGWYCGVWGIFDGEKTDSCVIIRYLEKRNDNYFFKSGGGITALSDARAEYQEMIDKIYVPVY